MAREADRIRGLTELNQAGGPGCGQQGLALTSPFRRIPDFQFVRCQPLAHRAANPRDRPDIRGSDGRPISAPAPADSPQVMPENSCASTL